MARIGYLKDDLLAAVANELAGLGFKRRGRSCDFETDVSLGTGTFHVMFVRIRSVDEWDVGADMSIYVEPIEQLLQTVSAGEATVGVDIGNWVEGRAKRWVLKDRCDVHPVAREMEDAVRGVVLPFFDQFSDLGAREKALSIEGKTAWRLCGAPVNRALVLLAIELLRGRNPDDFVTARKKLFQEVWPNQLATFESKATKMRDHARSILALGN